MTVFFILFGLFSTPFISHADSILYIGDSHSRMTDKERAKQSRRFGTSFVLDLESSGHNVDYYAICGATPQTWATGKSDDECAHITTHRKNDGTFDNKPIGFGPFRSLNNASMASTVVINLGDNLFDWQGQKNGPKTAASVTKSKILDQVQQLLNSLNANQKCIWISPCYHAPGAGYSKSKELVDRMYDALKEAINGRCSIVDSRPIFSATISNDGLHFTDNESALWGARVAAEVNDVLKSTNGTRRLGPGKILQ